MFPNLDDVVIRYFTPWDKDPDEILIPFSTPKLGGKLVLVDANAAGPWEHLAVTCGLRFKFIHAGGVIDCVPVLFAACAETLETFQFDLLPNGGMRSLVHLDMNFG